MQRRKSPGRIATLALCGVLLAAPAVQAARPPGGNSVTNLTDSGFFAPLWELLSRVWDTATSTGTGVIPRTTGGSPSTDNSPTLDPQGGGTPTDDTTLNDHPGQLP